jgi:hypothetical protein
MFLSLIKILLWFFAINYSVVLLKEIHALRRYPLLHALCFISLTIMLIIHHNFFHIIIKSSNYQIIKLVSCIFLIRVPVVFLRWFFIGALNLTIDTEDANKQNRGGWYPGRAPNRRIVSNGISTLKPAKINFICALMLLALCGNWIGQHLLLCAGIICTFYLYKNSLRILNFLKNY